MGDAGSERSKAPSLPPRCPCGFWGSSKTMNLCSKCFAETGFCHVDQAGLELLSSSDPPASASQSAGITDFQKKQPDDDSAPSTSNSQSDLFSEETTSDNNNTSITTPTLSPSQQPLPTELNVTSPSKEECGPCTDTAHVSLITPTKRSCGTDSQSENEASPVKRPRLLENTERSEETSRSKQKSRR
ncbi:ZFAND3 isoform 3, partial [Pan troglodytes]